MLPHEFDGRTHAHIRLKPAKNKQTKGVFLAKEHLWN